jgi:hypothetical protein
MYLTIFLLKILNIIGDIRNHDPSSLRGEALDEDFANFIETTDSKMGLVNLRLSEAIVSYAFDDLASKKDYICFVSKYENEVKGYFTMGFIQTWLSTFHYECFLMTGHRIHRRLGRRSHRMVQYWSKTGTEMLIGPNCLLDAMADVCLFKVPIQKLIEKFLHYAKE